MKDLKIGLISHEFPPYMFGGIASNCYDLAYSLSKKKISTIVFCGRSKVTHVQRLNNYLQVVRFPFFDFPPRYLWFQIQNYGKFPRLCEKCDILHAVNPIASAFFVYYNRKLKKPFVVTTHHEQLGDLKMFINSPLSEWTIGDLGTSALSYVINDFLIRTCWKASNHIIVPGLFTVQYMQDVGYDLDFQKVSVIYNGINFDKINNIINGSSPVERRPEQQRPSIMFYGSLLTRKGIIYLIKAMICLSSDFPDLRLRIFGKGPLESNIRKWISKADLADRVDLLGHVPYEELITEIRNATVVVLPSLYEVGPFIAALEAMALRKALVVFDFPFTREFVLNMDNAVLARAGDGSDLTEKIRLLLEDRDLRRKLGANAHRYVKERHDWDNLVERYLEIYESCLN